MKHNTFTRLAALALSLVLALSLAACGSKDNNTNDTTGCLLYTSDAADE